MTNNADILKSLTPGAELSLFADASAAQATKMGLMIGAAILVLVGLYLASTQLGLLAGAKKSVMAWAGVALAFGASFLLYTKYQMFSEIALNEPVLKISRMGLELPQQKTFYEWQAISEVQLEETRRRPKQAAQDEVSYAVNVQLAGPPPQVIPLNYEILNVPPELLAQTLENYRKSAK